MAGRPRTFDEAAVLSQAAALFWQNGYAGTGLSELEQVTGLGRQSLYGAFGDKRALFEKVVEHYEQTVLRPGMLALLEAPGSPRKNVERLIGSWEHIASAPGFNGCLVGNCVAEMSARDPEIADVLAPKLKLMEGWLIAALKRAQREGEVSKHLDVEAVARAILAMMQGISVVARAHRDRAFVRGVAESAVRLLDMP
jgi:TetR/AcrR family transcriptional repressor of nem operon